MFRRENRSFWVIGLALFAMFFGAGNLIFPLFVGQISQNHSIGATCGFLFTGVALPFAGVVAMVVYRGDYAAFFRLFGRHGGFLLTLLLLTVWIPLGSAPRCITLAHASLSSCFSVPTLWLFSLGYSLVVALLTYQRTRILPILGLVLTPLLLLCLAAVVIKGVWGVHHPLEGAGGSHLLMSVRGAKEGYNTMDLIASFFFSASILTLLSRQKSNSNPLRTTLLASLVGMALLSLVYIGLIQLAALHSELLVGVPKDQILPALARSVLGSHVAIAASFAILLACFTTSVALQLVYVDFLSESLFKKKNLLSLGVTTAITFGMSILGLQGITSITSPILQFFYPLLISMICFNLGSNYLKSRRELKDSP